MIRFVVSYRQYNNTETLKQARIFFLIRLLTSCKVGDCSWVIQLLLQVPLEYQLAKLALCFDWLCTDAAETGGSGYCKSH